MSADNSKVDDDTVAQIGKIVDKILSTTDPSEIGKLCRALYVNFKVVDFFGGPIDKSFELEEHVFKYGDEKGILNFLRFCPYTFTDDLGIPWDFTNFGIAYSRYPTSDKILKAIGRLIRFGTSCMEEQGDLYMGPKTLEILDKAFYKGYLEEGAYSALETVVYFLGHLLGAHSPVKDYKMVINKLKEYEWSSRDFARDMTVIEWINDEYFSQWSGYDEHDCTGKECCSQWSSKI